MLTGTHSSRPSETQVRVSLFALFCFFLVFSILHKTASPSWASDLNAESVFKRKIKSLGRIGCPYPCYCADNPTDELVRIGSLISPRSYMQCVEPLLAALKAIT